MRPHLHPDMGQVVICARVARQLTAWRMRRYHDTLTPPPLAARFCSMLLPPEGFGMLRFALHSLAVYLDLGYTSGQWLQNVLEAAHFGNSFRRCFFFAYKENRRAYPPVSNTGVQSPSEAAPGQGRRRIPRV